MKSDLILLAGDGDAQTMSTEDLTDPAEPIAKTPKAKNPIKFQSKKEILWSGQ